MTTITEPILAWGDVTENVVLLDSSVTSAVCEGMNVALASFQALYIQYQKHHFVTEGSEFYSAHEWFGESAGEVRGYVHELGERVNNLGGVPVASFARLAELCCFTPEADGVFGLRSSIESDLAAEQAMLQSLRRLAAQAESLGDRATRYLYEKILLETEDRAAHADHFLAHDSLTQAFVGTH